MADFRSVFLFGLRTLLLPVARYCLRHSLYLQDVAEAMKLAFLDAADAELASRAERRSALRLSTMTGVHRRDVERLQNQGVVRDEPMSLSGKVVLHWQQHPRYITKSRTPRVLTFEGDDAEFKRLVADVSKEITPGTILFELERVGAVRRVRGGLRLERRVFNSAVDPQAAFRMLSADIEDLVVAVEENVMHSSQLPHLHLTTRFDNIDPGALPRIREWLIREGSALHQKARNFLSRHDRDLNPRLKGGEGKASISLGTVGLVKNVVLSTGGQGDLE